METEKRLGTENEQVRTPRQKKLILLGVLVLLLIVVTISVVVVEVKKSKSKTLAFMNPIEKEFTKTKTVTGRVVPSHTDTIYVNPKGSIQEIFVKEGETVTKGQKLFSYEGSSIEAKLGQAEINKKLAETSVTQLQEQITSLEQAIDEALSTTSSDTDDQATLVMKTTSIQSLQAELNNAKDQQRAAVLKEEKYTLEAENLNAQLEALVVKSNTTGVIKNLDTKIGQGFQATNNQQKAIMQIISNDPFQIEGMLTEKEKAKIKSGQSITVTSNVVSNKKWNGIISEVSDFPTYKTPTNKDKEIQKGIPYYSFKATLDSQKGIYPGYSTELDVVVQSKQLLAVPKTSIKGSGKSTYVYVLKKGKIHKQKIETGQQTGKWVAVVKGLREDTNLVKNPNWTVRPGTKIELK